MRFKSNPRTCSDEGCGRPIYARGLCQMHYRRWKRHEGADVKRGDKAPLHGHSKVGHVTPTYSSWQHMKKRCLDPSWHNYRRYGGRGITICDRWLGRQGFVNFLADLGEKPPDTSLDRINNDGNYEPSNCRWATPKEQNNNRSLRIRS